MTNRLRRIGFAAGASLMALGMAAAVFATSPTQNTSAPAPAFSPQRGGGRMGGPMGPLGMIGPLVQRLGLTDAQKDQVKAIMGSHSADFKTLGAQAATARKALEQAMLIDPVNDAAVQSASADLAIVESQMAVAGAHVRAEIFQILTDAQKAEVKQIIAQREAMTGRGRGRGR